MLHTCSCCDSVRQLSREERVFRSHGDGRAPLTAATWTRAVLSAACDAAEACLLLSDTRAVSALLRRGGSCLYVFTLLQVHLSARFLEVWLRGRRANVHVAGSVLQTSQWRGTAPASGCARFGTACAARGRPPPCPCPDGLAAGRHLCSSPSQRGEAGGPSAGVSAVPLVGVFMSQGVQGTVGSFTEGLPPDAT